MIMPIVAAAGLSVAALLVAFAHRIDSAHPVRVRVEEVDHPAAKRAGARR